MTVDLLDIIDKRIADAIADAVGKRDRALAEYSDACHEIMRLHAVKLVQQATALEPVSAEAVTGLLPIRRAEGA
jgi:hypothetical protein